MSDKQAVTVIAEAGVNHNGSLDLALKLVETAAEAGADIVKFQTFKASKLVTKSASRAEYQKANTGSSESQFDLIRKLELSPEAHHVLLKRCQSLGIEFMSTPFDDESLDFLVNELRVVRLKIPSGEITNAPFLLRMARAGKPLIVSTGMCYLTDVERALAVLAYGLTQSGAPARGEAEIYAAYSSDAGQAALKANVSVLHCTTEYPAPINEVNLQAMQTLSTAFGLPVGFSDHTQGIAVPIASIAAGATIVEKHFTLDRSMPGPDHKASLEPQELRAMIKGIREISAAMGDGIKRPAPSEQPNAFIARKSLVALRAIAKGEAFSPENLTCKRPGSGRTPFDYWELLGTPSDRAYAADELIS